MLIPTTPLGPGGGTSSGRRYDPVEARTIMATLYTTGTVLAAAVDVLPQWPGVDRRLVLGLTLAGALAAFVTRRLRALPLPFAAALTVCGNSLIAAAQAGGGTGTGALASVYALSLTVAFLMYPTPLLIGQIAYATAAETVVLVLLRGEGASALVTVVVTIGSACSAGIVVRKLADLRADAELELAWRAAHDALTGLANRVALTRAWAALPTAPGTTVGVLVLDLRGFKQVNDVLGHHYGDALLVEVGARLHGLAGEGLACRLGGDEFGVLLPGVDTGTARRRADAVVAALQEPYRVNDVEVPLGVTVGVAVHNWGTEHAEPDHDASLRALSALLAEADAAMYYARELRAAVACSDDLRGAAGGTLPRPRAGLPGALGGVTGSGVTRDPSDTDDHRSGAANV
ncbi:MAG TPA: GGDEF domain-containing protein [Kineosporiaceae bacterium]|nr:GGDEF domain-containing protein [Kineosporiaceae bacterium]